MQLWGLHSLRRGDVHSVTLVCMGYSVRDDLGKTVTFRGGVFAACPVPSSCSAIHVPTLPSQDSFLSLTLSLLSPCQTSPITEFHEHNCLSQRKAI